MVPVSSVEVSSSLDEAVPSEALPSVEALEATIELEAVTEVEALSLEEADESPEVELPEEATETF